MRFSAKLLLLFAVSSLFAVGRGQTAGTLPETTVSEIEYTSPEAAIEALRQKPGVTFYSVNDWLFAEDHEMLTIWSFAPKLDPAYPTIIKRKLLVKDGKVSIQMFVVCKASKLVCDNVVLLYRGMNEKIAKSVQKNARQ